MTIDEKYNQYVKELTNLIAKEDYHRILSQDKCELEYDFLGFLDVYKPLSELIPKNKIIIDFGCYLAAQSYYFAEHKQYIGVDVINMERFTPKNASHYIGTIQSFIKNEVPKLFKTNDKLSYCAICSYVPDFEATKLVRKTFPNVFCYYP